MSHHHEPSDSELLRELLRVSFEQLRVSREVLEVEQANMGFLAQIVSELTPHVFTLKGTNLMANPIAAGSTGQLGWTLQDNGVNDTTGFALTLTLSSTDTGVTFAPATTDASGGTIPLANQTVVTVPAADTNTTATITASSPAPDGSTATGSITVTLTPTPQKFTLVGTQLLP